MEAEQVLYLTQHPQEMVDQAVELHIQTQVEQVQQTKAIQVVVLLTMVVVIMVAEAVVEQDKLV